MVDFATARPINNRPNIAPTDFFNLLLALAILLRPERKSPEKYLAFEMRREAARRATDNLLLR